MSRLWLFTVAVALAVGCDDVPVAPEEEPVAIAPPVSVTIETAVEEGSPQACVEAYDPAVDYFPDRAAPRFATGFTVEYRRHYKVVTLPSPWPGGTPERYLLVQCGTPVPEGFDPARTFEVPARTAITTSTTELPAFVTLGLVDRLRAHTTLDYVYAPEVRAAIEAGAVVGIGSEGALDLERVIEMAPDVLFADTLGSPELDPHGQLRTLRAAGVDVALVPSFLEPSVLARAEWIVYVALFFNREAAATAAFDAVAARYSALAALGRAARTRPEAITGGPAGDVWHVPGGRSHAAALLADAGFDYPWADDRSAGSLALSFETVLDVALGADWWLHPSRWTTAAEILAADERLAALPAFRRRQVVAHDARTNGRGGNDYFESGVARPDLVLADLLSIAHPELLPEHRLVYHRGIATGAETAR